MMKEWKEENRIKDKLKRAKQIPFKKEEEEIVLGHVESKEIFKNLQEISRYLDRDK